MALTPPKRDRGHMHSFNQLNFDALTKSERLDYLFGFEIISQKVNKCPHSIW